MLDYRVFWSGSLAKLTLLRACSIRIFVGTPAYTEKETLPCFSRILRRSSLDSTSVFDVRLWRFAEVHVRCRKH